ncbi:carboxylesterase family protein [Calycomorphotria hydatis]|uniref:Alpha/beta hydrolase family protein n=1 Tax=Calycomorphotria hydatis TaxID=2528027 RepID=A0A517T5R6_9PLAN|nr:alpha/beta hydrolase-fold protein [Calycomorphotria hydatis]QDT63713.1 Alpha/beta hydrolase family protein [Calycomorphotria hydatis]
MRIVLQSILAISCLIIGGMSPSVAGTAVLKNGTKITGKLVPVRGLSKRQLNQQNGEVETTPILMIDSGYKRHFVAQRQVESSEEEVILSQYEKFKLSQKDGRTGLEIRALGTIRNMTPFDEFGRRTVQISTPRGPLNVVQGITELTPQHISVSGLTHRWEFGLSTTSVPSPQLRAVLANAIDSGNPDDRLAVVRFFLQAGLHREAIEELQLVATDFPELAATIGELQVEVRRFQTLKVLAELRRRQRSGQHEFVYNAVRTFPRQGLGGDLIRELRLLQNDYEDRRELADRALFLLGELEAQLEESSDRTAVSNVRSVIRDELDFEAIDRLRPFLDFSRDGALSAREMLALAISGWALGPANAVTEFDKALQIWQARLLVDEFLRTDDPLVETDLLDRMGKLEGIGPETVRSLIPWVQPWRETPDTQINEVFELQTKEPTVIPGSSGQDPATPTRYTVLLPPEYSPNRAYPVIVALRPADIPLENAIDWWGAVRSTDAARTLSGQAPRLGYIVIAPDYSTEGQTEYDYSVRAHAAVLHVLRDARKRFHIDSDRVVLAGHGMGADAAFDIGMSHPDVFAGVVPISGLAQRTTLWYWSNAKDLPFYIVNGEFDRDSLGINSMTVYRMMKYGYDVRYTDYKGRGFESYFEEIHDIFDWIDLQRRTKYPKEIEVDSLRPSEQRFYWVEVSDLPFAPLPPDGRGAKPRAIEARITPGNTIYLKSAAARHTLWLAPEFVNFDERLRVRMAARNQFYDFVEPNYRDLLTDFKTRGDRQKTYLCKLVID